MSQSPETLNDVVIDSLKKNYFSLALTENRPHTPAVTEKLDHLEAAIRDMQSKTKKDT